MEKHGFTNQSLADASSVPIGTISGIRSGKIRSPSYSTICAMLSAMGEPVNALSDLTDSITDSAEDMPLPDNGFTEHQQMIMEQNSLIASLSATLNARNESAKRNADRYAKLETQLQTERSKNTRLQYALIIVCMLIIALAVVYIWGVRNLTN